MRLTLAAVVLALTLGGPTIASGAEGVSKGQAAMQQAAARQKYLFLFFWKERNEQTNALWGVLEGTMTKMADWADWTAIQVDDPAEKPLVDRFDVRRAPMPLVLALAPNGAITKGLAGSFDDHQLRQAFVSPGAEKCLKAIQERKLVLLCVQRQPAQNDQAVVLQGVRDFKLDPQYNPVTEIVVLSPDDQTEASFLQQLHVNPQIAAPVTLLMAPPGSLVARFEGAVTKDQLVARLAAASSSCCPGGKCGPNGCGPKK